MNFEWDDTKREINIKKHGIDFINASKIFDSHTLTSRMNVATMEKSVMLHLEFLKDGLLSWYIRKMET